MLSGMVDTLMLSSVSDRAVGAVRIKAKQNPECISLQKILVQIVKIGFSSEM